MLNNKFVYIKLNVRVYAYYKLYSFHRFSQFCKLSTPAFNKNNTGNGNGNNTENGNGKVLINSTVKLENNKGPPASPRRNKTSQRRNKANPIRNKASPNQEAARLNTKIPFASQTRRSFRSHIPSPRILIISCLGDFSI